jgi:hypothetical protein
VNSLNLVRRIKSRASGEGGERGPCNQGWGPGILFLPRHHVLRAGDVSWAGRLETRSCALLLGCFGRTRLLAAGSDGFMRTTAVAVACPHCQSKAVRRAKRRGMFELSVLSMIPMRPFRCQECDLRFYAFVSAPDAIQSEGEPSR